VPSFVLVYGPAWNDLSQLDLKPSLVVHTLSYRQLLVMICLKLVVVLTHGGYPPPYPTQATDCLLTRDGSLHALITMCCTTHLGCMCCCLAYVSPLNANFNPSPQKFFAPKTIPQAKVGVGVLGMGPQ